METKEDRNQRMREYMRKYLKSEKGKAYRQSKKFKLSQKQSLRKWRDKPENRLKYMAHTIIHNAVRFAKKAKQPCEICGTTPAHGHHDDYNKPLEVRWLCAVHHAEHHRRGQSSLPEPMF